MTTLFVDYNNIAMMKIFNRDVGIRETHPNYEMWEYLVFETIYDYIRKFKISEVIIAKDNRRYWRKKYFSRYKEKRKDQKDKEVDWDTMYGYMNKFICDMNNHFPFKCFDVKYCEADDIIGVLASYVKGPVIILSSDKDYKQCLTKNIRQYSPYTNKFITCSDPEKFLIESSLTGQAKDGIFNVITPEDWPNEFRKPGFGPKKYETWVNTGLDIMLQKKIVYKKKGYSASVLPYERYKRNRVLMDFKYIPTILSNEIKSLYDNYEISEISELYKFFEEKGWSRFLNEYEMTENLLLKFY